MLRMSYKTDLLHGVHFALYKLKNMEVIVLMN